MFRKRERKERVQGERDNAGIGRGGDSAGREGEERTRRECTKCREK